MKNISFFLSITVFGCISFTTKASQCAGSFKHTQITHASKKLPLKELCKPSSLASKKNKAPLTHRNIEQAENKGPAIPLSKQKLLTFIIAFSLLRSAPDTQETKPKLLNFEDEDISQDLYALFIEKTA